MSDWKEVVGYGMPASSMLQDCVVLSIREGNLAGRIECRVSPVAWERCVIQLGEHRPVEFEQRENRAVMTTFVCGRKVSVSADPDIESHDVVRYRAAP